MAAKPLGDYTGINPLLPGAEIDVVVGGAGIKVVICLPAPVMAEILRENDQIPEHSISYGIALSLRPYFVKAGLL